MIGPSVVVVASGDGPLLFTPVRVLPDGADDNYAIFLDILTQLVSSRTFSLSWGQPDLRNFNDLCAFLL